MSLYKSYDDLLRVYPSSHSSQFRVLLEKNVSSGLANWMNNDRCFHIIVFSYLSEIATQVMLLSVMSVGHSRHL